VISIGVINKTRCYTGWAIKLNDANPFYHIIK